MGGGRETKTDRDREKKYRELNREGRRGKQRRERFHI